MNVKDPIARTPLARAATLLLLLLTLAASGAACSRQDRPDAGEGLDHIREAAQTLEQAGHGDSPPVSREATTATVRRAVDGDTLEVFPAIESTEDVRLVGVDTPESAVPGEQPQPLGERAAAFTARRLEGQRVFLTFDEELMDPYGRALAYAKPAGSSSTHNELLVRRGLAQVAIFESNDRLSGALYAAQDGARARGAGIWGLPQSRQCLLAHRGNGIGEGSAGC